MSLSLIKEEKLKLFLMYIIYGMIVEKFLNGRFNIEVVKVMFDGGIKII